LNYGTNLTTNFKITIFCFFIALSFIVNASEVNTPKFDEIHNTKIRKETFFNYFAPLAQKINTEISSERSKIISIFNQNKLSTKDILWLNQISKKYKTSFNEKNIEDSKVNLLSRIDIIPVSLLMVQAANESAWGTSRFAKEGNNFFGEWCFTQKCGLVPKKRNKGATHEVKKFKTAEDSVRSYIHNLNTHSAYDSFRTLRLTQRQFIIFKSILLITLKKVMALYTVWD
tara:strand:+ start:114043 stop:114729 length:687 start_codon:yes stop_codon:yes gene_type:complete